MARWNSSSRNKGRTPKSSPDPDPEVVSQSRRITAPTPAEFRDDLPSPMWVPILMAVLLAVGTLIIVTNYLDWLPGGTDNIYLGIGLLFILAGTMVATRWK